MQLIGLLLMFLIYPITIGGFLNLKSDNEFNNHFSFRYLTGFLCLLAIFHILCVIATLCKLKFHILYYAYLFILSFISICIIIILYKNKNLKILHTNYSKLLKIKFLYIIIGLIIIQIIWQTYSNIYIYGDDYSYITMVNDIVQSDTIYQIDYRTGNYINSLREISYKYLFTSYYPFLAVIAKLSRIHPLILCKSIIPGIYIIFSYMAVWMTGTLLFPKSIEKRVYFLYFYLIINFFGCFSWYTISFRSLTWIWQSKAVLAIIILPFVFCFTNKIFDGDPGMVDLTILGTAVMAACGVTLMGVGLAPIMIVVIVFTKVWSSKRWNLLLKGAITCSPAIISLGLVIVYKLFFCRGN